MIEKFASIHELGYTVAEKEFNANILRVLDECTRYDPLWVKNNLSTYAYQGYEKGFVNEIMAEYFAKTEPTKEIDRILREVMANDET